MSKKLVLPDSPSVANAAKDGRMSAPSARRNAQAIRDVVARTISNTGHVLEIASGTGEHIVGLGQAHPGVTWQPTDIDPDRLVSITAWIAAQGGENILPPRELDVSQPGWSHGFAPQDAVLLSNLLHLVSADVAQNVVHETAAVLKPNGVSIYYGPFMRGQDFASPGDQQFHQSLVSQDPLIGYKSLVQVQSWQIAAGLQPSTPVPMPANNLILIARKPATT